MRSPGSFGAWIGIRMLAGIIPGAVAWYPLGRWSFDLSTSALGPVQRGLPEIVRFIACASIASEAVALAVIVASVLMARAGGSVPAAVAGMLVPGFGLIALALALPADQTAGIIALVAPPVACFCSALCASWSEVTALRTVTPA